MVMDRFVPVWPASAQAVAAVVSVALRLYSTS